MHLVMYSIMQATTVCGILVTFDNPSLLSFYFTLSDVQQLGVRLLVIPIFTQTLSYFISLNAKYTVIPDTAKDRYMQMVPLTMVALLLRFLQINIGSFWGNTAASAASTLSEIFGRLYHTRALKAFHKHVLRWNQDKIIKTYDCELYKMRRGRTIIVSMIVEYICIFVAPAITVLFQRSGLVINAGYNQLYELSYVY